MELMKKLMFLASLLGSYLIDSIIFLLLLYLIRDLGAAAYILQLSLKMVYRIIATGLWGSTLGMSLLKLKLNRYSLKICLKREIYRIGSSLFFLGYLTAIFDSYGRTLHDMAANTVVVYKNNDITINTHTKLMVNLAALIMTAMASLSWLVGFLLNDIGLIGLKRAAVSGEYHQSFAGDNLLSLSQNELYLKSIGRKYTTPVEYNDGVHLLRISNKQNYTELYRLDVEGNDITGSYIGNTQYPLQFVCSGIFKQKTEMIGLTPEGIICLMDNTGSCYAKGKLSIANPITLGCGDLDGDSKDEAAVMGRNGDVEIFKYADGAISSLYSGKIGEDILPETFYISKDMVISGEEKDNRVLYTYAYDNGSLIYKGKTTLHAESSGRITAFGNNTIISYISRNNMIFSVGDIQRLEVYRVKGKTKRLYSFGRRKGRFYDYKVRSLENIADLDGDGKKEVILKAMDKDQVEGERYRIEIYTLSPILLGVNRVLTFLEGIMKL